MNWRVGSFGDGGTAIYEGTRRVCLIKSKEDADLIVASVNARQNANGSDREVEALRRELEERRKLAAYADQLYKEQHDRDEAALASAQKVVKAVKVQNLVGWQRIATEMRNEHDRGDGHFSTGEVEAMEKFAEALAASAPGTSTAGERT